MYKEIVLFAAVVLACQGGIVPEKSNDPQQDIVYYVYTRENARVPVKLYGTLESVRGTDVRFRDRTAIIVHGHEASSTNSLNPTVKDAFLENSDITVVVVDWSVQANQRYSNAVAAVPRVGEAIAMFIRYLVLTENVKIEDLHLVGFDLGAHVVGFTGRHLDRQIPRITALDPSASQWRNNNERIRSTDAIYVEGIHTDGSGLTSNGIGTNVGHVDFFPNGGGNQPGCLLHSCSHDRAWLLFAATLTHNHLIGNQCTTSTQLSLNRCRGYALPMGNNDFIKFGSGTFRVNTGRTYPY